MIVDYMADEDFDGEGNDGEGNPATKSLVKKLKKDLKLATMMIGIDEARYLVDSYYEVQKFRMAIGNQIRALGESEEPTVLIGFLYNNMVYLEDTIKQSLGEFSGKYAVGRWLKSIVGIGPVLSAGFLVTFDIRRQMCLAFEDEEGKGDMEWVESTGDIRKKVAGGKLFVHDQRVDARATAGAFWRFAGMEPSAVWEKGTKGPWNARAKVLCFKAGECFVKVQNNDDDVYGKLLIKRKEAEQARNEAGEYAEQAREKLEKCNTGKSTDAYKHYSEGRLPPAHIHARARRWVMGIFLSRLHNVMYQDYFHTDPPLPYIFSNKHKGGIHTKYIAPPFFNRDDGEPLSNLYEIRDGKK